jgi:undecaprenyl-diphosphatase
MLARFVLICAGCFAALTVLVVGRFQLADETGLVRCVVRLHNSHLTLLIGLASFITSAIPTLALVLVISGLELARMRRLAWGSLWATGALLGNIASNLILRMAIGRLPPKIAYIPDLLPELHTPFQHYAYPSGHAGAALVAYSALVVFVWPNAMWRWITLALAVFVIALTGLGRVYLGVHWPTDVLGGYLLAGCWLGFGLMLKTRGDAQR